MEKTENEKWYESTNITEDDLKCWVCSETVEILHYSASGNLFYCHCSKCREPRNISYKRDYLEIKKEDLRNEQL